jgi:hypothetical protein
LQRGRAETQQRMREGWQRTQAEFWNAVRRDGEIRQRIAENNAKAYSTYDRVYRPGEKHWSEPTEAQKHMDLGEAEAWAQRGKFLYDYARAYDQLRHEAAERQRRQAAAQRAQDDSRLMGGPNYRPQPRTRVTDRDGGPGDRDRDVPQRLSPASAATIRNTRDGTREEHTIPAVMGLQEPKTLGETVVVQTEVTIGHRKSGAAWRGAITNTRGICFSPLGNPRLGGHF